MNLSFCPPVDVCVSLCMSFVCLFVCVVAVVVVVCVKAAVTVEPNSNLYGYFLNVIFIQWIVWSILQ